MEGNQVTVFSRHPSVPIQNGLPLTILIYTVEVGLDLVREEGEVGADYVQAGAGQEYDVHTPLGLFGVVIMWRVCSIFTETHNIDFRCRIQIPLSVPYRASRRASPLSLKIRSMCSRLFLAWLGSRMPSLNTH